MSNNTDNGSLLEFPLDITLKVMGRDEAGFEDLVLELIKQHVPAQDQRSFTHIQSRKKNYISYSIRFIAHTREQLDGLYLKLNSHPKVLMVL
jgi:uncharacterized protein